MTMLHCGLKAMHNSIAIELLYQIKPNVWRCKMLFIIAEDRTISFGPYDRVTPLHSKAA